MFNILSLITTPLIIFILPAITIWLKNQTDLNHDIRLLFPFLALFFASLVIGYLLLRLSKHRSMQYLLWGYYFIGPFFLLHNYIRTFPLPFLETAGGVYVSLLVFLVAVIILTRRINPDSGVYLFSIFGCLLLLFGIYQFTTEYIPEKSPGSGTPIEARSQAKYKTRPNIYHIVFDEFQTEKFIATLTPDVRTHLPGFIFFPNNTSVYGRSAMSVASMFLGRSYELDSSQKEYLKSAFNSESSILYWLRKEGYRTHFYWYPMYTDMKYKLINNINFFSKYVKVVGFRTLFPAFLKIWLYSNFPEYLSKFYVHSDIATQLKNKNLLPESAVITSYFAFLNFLTDEEELPETNRFTYMHLILPHFPNILAGNCSYSDNLNITSDIEQSQCATSLIMKFINTLQGLGRFKNSLIIISADHGGRHKLKNGELVSIPEDHYGSEWSWARSRALLLIKPIGISNKGEMIVSDAESTLIDIAPTIAKSVSLSPHIDFEGIPLVNPTPLSLKRQRFYYFYEKNKPDELTDEMTRFIIENNTIRLDSKIKIKGNNSK
jgi:hypothetical protein